MISVLGEESGGGGSMLVGFYVLGDRIVFSENFEFSEIST